jgi:hypothetical protein
MILPRVSGLVLSRNRLRAQRTNSLHETEPLRRWQSLSSFRNSSPFTEAEVPLPHLQEPASKGLNYVNRRIRRNIKRTWSVLLFQKFHKSTLRMSWLQHFTWVKDDNEIWRTTQRPVHTLHHFHKKLRKMWVAIIRCCPVTHAHHWSCLHSRGLLIEYKHTGMVTQTCGPCAF